MSKQNKTTNSGRRAFLGGASMSIAGAAALGFGFAPAAQAMSTKTLIYVFLRGGTDGLNLIPPRTGTNYTLYEAARPTLALTPSQSLNLAGVQSFGIHPSASALRQVFANNQLAIIQACGHPAGTETRSHFDAQEQIELGTPGNQTSSNGWLARYLETTMEAPGAIFTALASSSNPPTSLVGWPDVATLDSTGGFHPNVANRRFRNTHLEALRALYQSGTGSLDVAALAAVDAVDLINSLELDEYSPAGGVNFPNTGLGRDMEFIAQMIDQNLGIQAATVNIGGWDTHSNQGQLNGGYPNRVAELSDALAAFHNDQVARGNGANVAIVVQSEFGRQVTENSNRGTDHGLGNPMLVLHENLNGGFYGSFPGLANNQKISDSLRPTTDFRQVLAGVTEGLLANSNSDYIFNSEGDGFSYSPPLSWFA